MAGLVDTSSTISSLLLNQTQFGNFSSSSEALRYSPVEAAIIVLILVAIIIGTVVGNVLVCIAVCLVKKLRRPYNYLIVSLAVSDICVAVLVMPLATASEIIGSWTFGTVMCNLWVSFDVLSCTASILNLCVISVDRYYAITKPLQYCVKRTPRRMMLWVSLVWLGAACISLPPLLILGNVHSDKDGTSQCLVNQHVAYQIYATMGSFYLPLSVMLFVYYKIFRAAKRIVQRERQSRRHMETHCYLEVSVNGGAQNVGETSPRGQQHRPSTSSSTTTCSGHTSFSTRCFPRYSNESQSSQIRVSGRHGRPSRNSRLQSLQPKEHEIPSQKRIRFQLAKERKASTTLGIIMSAFTICWLPFFVLALVRPFLADQDSIRSLSSIFLWLGYANSLLNPIIYATLNRDFRKPFKQILFFKCSSLNDMMREEFYHSQFGDPQYTVVHNPGAERADRLIEPSSSATIAAAAAAATAPAAINNESFL